MCLYSYIDVYRCALCWRSCPNSIENIYAMQNIVVDVYRQYKKPRSLEATVILKGELFRFNSDIPSKGEAAVLLPHHCQGVSLQGGDKERYHCWSLHLLASRGQSCDDQPRPLAVLRILPIAAVQLYMYM